MASFLIRVPVRAAFFDAYCRAIRRAVRVENHMQIQA